MATVKNMPFIDSFLMGGTNRILEQQ